MKYEVTVTIDQSGDDPSDQILDEKKLVAYILEELENREYVTFGHVGFYVDVDAGVTVVEVERP